MPLWKEVPNCHQSHRQSLAFFCTTLISIALHSSSETLQRKCMNGCVQSLNRQRRPEIQKPHLTYTPRQAAPEKRSAACTETPSKWTPINGRWPPRASVSDAGPAGGGTRPWLDLRLSVSRRPHRFVLPRFALLPLSALAAIVS